MNNDAQLKLQSYLDKELSGPEAAEVERWLATDSDAKQLAAELKNTCAALVGHEADVKMPESREFFWSKIEREIQRTEQPATARRKLSWLDRLRRQLVPLSGFAIVTMVFSVVALHSLRSPTTSAEIEVLSDDMGAYTYRDQANKMTFVWFYDRNENEESTESAQPDSVLTQ